MAKKINSKQQSNFWNKTKTRLKKIFLFLLVSHLVYVLILKWVNPPVTTRMVSSFFSTIGKKVQMHRDYIGYNEMGKNVKLAVLAAEDQLFPIHHGFDFDAIEKALEWNKKKQGKKIRGASTISQQVAKNVFLWNGRSWLRKGLETYFTVLIELVWGKKRILEMYLNVAEMGEGIFGIQAAAQQYFHKDASKLTKSEAAWIASILPNPILYEIENPTSKIERKHDKVLRFMNNLEGDKEISELIIENGKLKIEKEK